VAGLEGIPEAITWVGGVVTMSGVGVIMIGQLKREQQEEDAAKASEGGIQLSEDNDGRGFSQINPLHVIEGGDDEDELEGLGYESYHPLKTISLDVKLTDHDEKSSAADTAEEDDSHCCVYKGNS
jgi:hypothetical protein